MDTAVNPTTGSVAVSGAQTAVTQRQPGIDPEVWLISQVPEILAVPAGDQVLMVVRG